MATNEKDINKTAEVFDPLDMSNYRVEKLKKIKMVSKKLTLDELLKQVIDNL